MKEIVKQRVNSRVQARKGVDESWHLSRTILWRVRWQNLSCVCCNFKQCARFQTPRLKPPSPRGALPATTLFSRDCGWVKRRYGARAGCRRLTLPRTGTAARAALVAEGAPPRPFSAGLPHSPARSEGLPHTCPPLLVASSPPPQPRGGFAGIWCDFSGAGRFKFHIVWQ